MVDRIGIGQMTSSSAERGRRVAYHSGNVDKPNTRRSTKRRDRKLPQIKTRGRAIGIGYFAASRPAQTNGMKWDSRSDPCNENWSKGFS
jgi:hypothetical protein